MTDPRTDQPSRGATAAQRRAGEVSAGANPAVAAGDPAQDGSAEYRERLRTPLWWYLAAVLVGLLMASEFLLASSGWITYLPFAVLVPGCVGLVWRLSSATVTVSNGTLSVGERTLPVNQIEQGIALDRVQVRMLVGRHSDPLAFDFIRSWIGPGVQLVLGHSPDSAIDSATETPGTATAPDGLDGVDGLDQPPTSDPPHREPYWVLSTRHPDRLLAAVAASQTARPGAA